MAKHFTAKFKLEAAKLYLRKAAETVNVSYSAIQLFSYSAIARWINKLKLERRGKTPAELPLTPEQLELREMKKKSNVLKWRIKSNVLKWRIKS
ncbi:transposase [Pantoea rodasii]|uniref:transposase n=1 Tax=Pantoea rodasii TaxID=1076549 RepID=UPI000FFBF622|nr:transposase [Pantoea rodasii]